MGTVRTMENPLFRQIILQQKKIREATLNKQLNSLNNGNPFVETYYCAAEIDTRSNTQQSAPQTVKTMEPPHVEKM